MSGKRTVVAALALTMCLLMVACSPVARYRVLTFFFDGVPTPPGMEEPGAEEAESPELGEALAAQEIRDLKARPRPQKAVVTMASYHKPYLEGSCNECHDMSGGGPGDVARDAALCDKCHLEQRQRDGWDHGPINLGTCIPCHESHQSVHDHLLSKPMTELCLSCHVDVVPTGPDYHVVPNFTDCVSCHDPHRMY